jgi:hypothetical protein
MGITTAARNKQKRTRILERKRARSFERYHSDEAHAEQKREAARVYSAAVLSNETPAQRKARLAYQSEYFKRNHDELQRKRRERRHDGR